MTFNIKVRWRISTFISIMFFLAFVITSIISRSGHSIYASGSLTQLSTDPYTNGNSQHKTEVESATYSYGSTIVSAFQVGRFKSEGSSNIGWATSKNGGASWAHGFLPGTTVYAAPKGTYGSLSNPSVIYDAAHHTWFISSLVFPTQSPTIAHSIIVSHSTDGVSGWSNPTTVVSSNTDYLDKDWIGCDNSSSSKFYGHCYIEWDDKSMSNLVQMSTSTDGGKTWGKPQATANKASGLAGQPLVQPNGTVIVPLAVMGGIAAFTSTDGGASWNAPVRVASAQAYYEKNTSNMLTRVFPSAGIDGAGKTYVVWQDCAFESGCKANDLVMSTSTNGTSWTSAQRIPLDSIGSGVDHFLPAFAVDGSTSGGKAHLALAYYYFPVANCSSSTCQLNIGFVSSTDGGNSWSKSMQLGGTMNLSWLANTSSGYMVGDYISASIIGGKAFPIFAVASNPNGGSLNEAMYTVGLPV